MACQLIMVSNRGKEKLFFISQNIDIFGLRIQTDEEQTEIINTDKFKLTINQFCQTDDNKIIINRQNFMVFLHPKEKIIFEDKTIESLIFSFLLPAEINIASKMRWLN